MENHAENVHQNLVPDLFFILVNNPKQPLHASNIFKKEDYQRPFKKLTLFFFQTQFLLIDEVFKNKKDLELMTSRSSRYKTSSQKFLY